MLMMMLMMMRRKDEEEKEKDMLREKSNNPNLKGGEKHSILFKKISKNCLKMYEKNN